MLCPLSLIKKSVDYDVNDDGDEEDDSENVDHDDNHDNVDWEDDEEEACIEFVSRTTWKLETRVGDDAYIEIYFNQ